MSFARSFPGSPSAVRRSAAVVAAASLLGVAGCGGSSGGSSAKAVNPNTREAVAPGDIPDNQAYVSYRPPGRPFSVKVPEGWARSTSGPATIFTDKLNSVRAESVPAKAPLTVAAGRSELSALASSNKGFRPGTVTAVARTAGKAVRITYTADSKPDPVTGKFHTDAVERYVFFHNGRDVILTLTGAKGADNVDPWKIVTNSLRFVR